MRCWVLGFRLRMEGVFTTTNLLSRFFILLLGVALIFHCFFFASFGPQAVGQPAHRNPQTNSEKLGATPKQRIKSEKVDLVDGKYRRTAKQTPLRSKKMSPKNEKSYEFPSVFFTPKMAKKKSDFLCYFCKSSKLFRFGGGGGF